MNLDKTKYLATPIGPQKRCLSCDFNLEGEDIFEALKTLYGEDLALKWASDYGWTKENPISFRNDIGVEIPEYYDGVVFLMCPKCERWWKAKEWVNTEEALKDERRN